MAFEKEMSWEDAINDIQTSDNFPWTEEQMKCLEENQEYHAKMLTLAMVRKQGPIKKVPKQPKRILFDLFKGIEGT